MLFGSQLSCTWSNSPATEATEPWTKFQVRMTYQVEVILNTSDLQERKNVYLALGILVFMVFSTELNHRHAVNDCSLAAGNFATGCLINVWIAVVLNPGYSRNGNNRLEPSVRTNVCMYIYTIWLPSVAQCFGPLIFSVNLFWWECYRTSLMKSQHGFM